MKDKNKTKPELLKEVAELRRQIAQLKKSQAKLKRAEKALRDREKTFRALADNANDGIFITVGKGAQAYANKRAAEITGYSVAELLKTGIKDLVHPDELNKVMERFRKRLAGEYAPPQYEITIMNKDGKSVPIELTAAKTVWQGQPADMVVIRDITERKRAEEVLRASEEKYHQIVSTSTDSIMIFDAKSKDFVEVNKAAEDLYGYSREEFLNMNILAISAEEEKTKESFKKVLRGELDHVPVRYHKKKDGTVFPVEISASQFDVQGRTFVCGVVRDITERKRAEEKVEAALKEKEILLREVHHRVKNNMQVISSLFNLQSPHIKDKKSLEIFRSCQNRVRSKALIHERLYQAEDLARVDIEEYVKGLTGHLFSSYGVSPEIVKLNIDIKDIFLDIGRAIPCGLIISELVSNSLKHAFPDRRKGEIQISLTPVDKDEIELMVSDDGVGLPQDLDLKKTESLGLHLAVILAEDQLQGSIDLNRSGGTKYVIRFRRKK